MKTGQGKQCGRLGSGLGNLMLFTVNFGATFTTDMGFFAHFFIYIYKIVAIDTIYTLVI